MKHFTKHSKYMIIALMSILIASVTFAQVTIPTGLTNAVQYIMQTVWTSDGTSSGTVNVHIDPDQLYIRTGFIQDGTGWNNKALGLDSSGNMVYVDANGVAPVFSLSPHIIPKINSDGDDLELSIMSQINNSIGVNTISPNYTMDIMSSVNNAFRVQAPGGNQTLTYTLIGSNTGFSSGHPFSFPSPNNQFNCSCDSSETTADCGTSFTTGSLEGPGTSSFDYCFDYVESASTPGLYNYNIYTLTTVIGGEDVLVVAGTNVGIRTNNPQAALHVDGNVRIEDIPDHTSPTQVLVPGPGGEIQQAPFPSGGAGGENNTASNLGGGSQIFNNKVGVDLQFRSILGGGLTQVSQQTNTITINTPAQTLARDNDTNTLSISSGNSVTLPAGGAAANAWNLTGNSGTSTANFIGTTDDQNLQFRVNNTTIGRLFTGGSILWGLNNTITADYATIAGGFNNQIDAPYGFIGGGLDNSIEDTGTGSFIAGGSTNKASGLASFAGGIGAMALHDNTFVRSNKHPFASTADNQFLIGPNTHVGINTNHQPNNPGLGLSGDITLIADGDGEERVIGFKPHPSGTGNNLLIQGQDGSPGTKGGDVNIVGGTGSTRGNVILGLDTGGRINQQSRSNIGVRIEEPRVSMDIIGRTWVNVGIPFAADNEADFVSHGTSIFRGTTQTQQVRRRVRNISGNGTVNSFDHILLLENNSTLTIQSCDTDIEGRELILRVMGSSATAEYNGGISGELSTAGSVVNPNPSGITLICHNNERIRINQRKQ